MKSTAYGILGVKPLLNVLDSVPSLYFLFNIVII